MKIAAIICEYNPFHNGHKYQLELAKKDFDAVICVMSGSFTQRGDIAIFDKWTRAEAAVKNGADIVLELPVRYSLSSANGFASGAVDIICATNVCDALIFGSECADIQKLCDAATLLDSESPQISEKIKNNLKLGMSYPAARSFAFEGLMPENLIMNPNNILAIEYISALKRRKSDITPITHPRSVGYFDSSETGGHASASHIREKIKKGEAIRDLSPFDCSGCERYDVNRLTNIFKYLLITEGSKLFDGINDAEPGLYNLLAKYSDLGTISDIIDACVTKRYTRSRLFRTVLRAVTGIKGGYREPSYLRLLAATEKGCEILSEIKKKSLLPIVTKAADHKNPDLELDIKATDIASLCAENPQKKGRDFLTSPIIVK